MNGSVKPEICTKMLRNWSEKLRANFHSTTLDSSVVRIFRLDDTFSEILKLAANPEEGQQLLQKDRKGENGEKKLHNKTRKAERCRSLSRPKL